MKLNPFTCTLNIREESSIKVESFESLDLSIIPFIQEPFSTNTIDTFLCTPPMDVHSASPNKGNLALMTCPLLWENELRPVPSIIFLILGPLNTFLCIRAIDAIRIPTLVLED